MCIRDRERIDVGSHNVLGKLPGSALNEIEANHPFLKRRSLFISGTHVTDEMGTGLVHTAPAHGMDDYHACLGKDLDFRSPVDEKGEFKGSSLGVRKLNELNKIFFAFNWISPHLPFTWC